MSLRLQINLLIAALMAFFIAVMVASQIVAVRKSVLEETMASNVVATRMLSAFISSDDMVSGEMLRAALQRLGRVRSTDLVLRAKDGHVVYESPPSPYKAGRFAPAWYAWLVTPAPMHQEFTLSDGALLVEANASRAVLDGWDDTRRLLWIGAAALLLVQGLVIWRVGRATEPLRNIVSGLESMERGHYHTRLPRLAGPESNAIAQAFNRMAQSIEDNLDARREALQAQATLRQSRELAHLVELRMEDERRNIARELHDETSQSVTAIRSLALSLVRRAPTDETRTVAQTIAEAAGHLHAVVHDLIPRLRPLALDSLGLADAIQNQVDDWRTQHPRCHFEVTLEALPDTLDERVTLAVFRIVQEAGSNALRHAAPQRIGIHLSVLAERLQLQIDNDGTPLAGDWSHRGGFGIRGMRERAQTLGGEWQIEALLSGARVTVRLPLTVPVDSGRA
jgi:two-component system sensor histidine kinase UhpB